MEKNNLTKRRNRKC